MKTQVAIIGGGPGGAAAAMFLAAEGISSTIIEKAQFPRYHIGESMTGECGNILRALGMADRMQAAGHPIKHGTRVVGPTGNNSFWVPIMGRCPERGLVENHAWQVRRTTFDQMMLNEAVARGANLVQAEVTAPIREGDAVTGLRIRTPGGAVEQVEAEVVLDGSGQTAFLARHGVTGPRDLGRYDKQVAIFSQVEGAVRDPGAAGGNTLIFYLRKFHWAWFIPLDEQSTSIGIVVPASYFHACGESKRDFFLREVREINPNLTSRLPDQLRLTEEVRAIPNYSYQVSNYTGKGFICIGDAHRFIDPIFSFGLYITTKEAQLASDAIVRHLNGPRRTAGNPFLAHERYCEAGLDVIQDMMDAFWENPLAFAHFVHHRYRDDFIDMFAGRVYLDRPSAGLIALRAINARMREREPAAV